MGRESAYQHTDLQRGPPEMLLNSLRRRTQRGKPLSQAKFTCLNILFNEQIHSFSGEHDSFVSSTPWWGLAGVINSTQHPSIQLNNQGGEKKSQKSIAVVSLDWRVTSGSSDPSVGWCVQLLPCLQSVTWELYSKAEPTGRWSQRKQAHCGQRGLLWPGWPCWHVQPRASRWVRTSPLVNGEAP